MYLYLISSDFNLIEHCASAAILMMIPFVRQYFTDIEAYPAAHAYFWVTNSLQI